MENPIIRIVAKFQYKIPSLRTLPAMDTISWSRGRPHRKICTFQQRSCTVLNLLFHWCPLICTSIVFRDRGIVMWQSLLFTQLIKNDLSNRYEIAPWILKAAVYVNTFLRPHLRNSFWKPFIGILLLLLLLVLLLLLLSMMILIIGFTCPPTTHFKFITKCDRCYYKVRQVLQSATIILQSATEHSLWSLFQPGEQRGTRSLVLSGLI